MWKHPNVLQIQDHDPRGIVGHTMRVCFYRNIYREKNFFSKPFGQKNYIVETFSGTVDERVLNFNAQVYEGFEFYTESNAFVIFLFYFSKHKFKWQ